MKLLSGVLRYHFHYDAAHRLVEALYLETDTDPVVWQVAYDGFGRKAVLRRNGEGVRFLYDGIQAVEVRREADDVLVAEYTYAQGFLMKLQKATVEHWFMAFAQGGYPRHGFDLAGALTDSFEYSTNGTLAYHQG
ncbi:MAG TPA: hypothetical protein VEI97_05530, partial [bacterium]|nr:hypothetical protein [bacterium]